MKALYKFMTAFGVIGFLAMVAAWIFLIIGWFMNLFKLFGHLPIFDIETIIRLLGILPIIGGIVGWF